MPVVNLALSIEAPELGMLSWSAFESLAVQMSKDLPVAVLAVALDELQERLIDQVCGPKWAPVRGLPAPFSCPRCGVSSDFARKGRRTRPRRFEPRRVGSRCGCGMSGAGSAARSSRRCW